MSANRDKSQNFTFVFSNLYQVYLKSKPGVSPKASVFKASELEVIPNRPLMVRAPFRAPGLSQVKPAAEQHQDRAGKPSLSLMGLKKDLAQLKEIQGKMRFLLKEIEELMSDE